MDETRQAAGLLEEFRPALEQFMSLIRQLGVQTTNKVEHGEIETFISEAGTEALRRLIQGQFDLFCNQEKQEVAVTGSDGVVRSHCRSGCERSLMTIFGEVTVRRKGYGAPNVGMVFPLDAALNLPRDKYSHGLRRRVAEDAATHSFDETVADIERTTGGRVPKRQSEEVTVRAAQDFEAFYSGRDVHEPEQTSDILVMTVDQKGVVMRKEDLRPATKKAAQKSTSQPGARLSPGEKQNRKRMATVAAVYTIEARERSPEEVMGLCPQENNRPGRAQCENKRVWASLEQEPEEVIQATLDEALRRDPNMKRPWAVLLDGGEKQLDIVLNLIFGHRPDVTIILDFIHVLEYVWKAAYSFCAVGSKEAQEWVCERALKILQGKASAVARGLREGLNQLSREKRKAVKKCADYLEKYEPLLHYHLFLREGLPIATGVIEGACRHLIKDRMDLTGARWRLKRAEAVLRIRSLRSSHHFDDYWAFHRKQEHQRNFGYAMSCPT
jgi:hypothetical protein